MQLASSLFTALIATVTFTACASNGTNEPADEGAIAAGCNEIWLPVCGTDGVTYGNDCFASAADADISCEGTCPCPSDVDPTDDDCPPDSCPEIWGPVCGVDGTTYSNECFADTASISVECDGECPCDTEDQGGGCCSSSTDVCSWNGDGVCDEGCGWGTDVDCEANPPPDSCPEIWAPVCGWDGVTYANDCFASNVAVECEGECPCW